MQGIDFKIIETLKVSPVVIIGETHGAYVNTEIIKFFVDNIKPKIVFFEWPQKWQDAVDKGSVDELSDIFKTLKDGRVTKNHLNLIQKLRENNTRIFCMDSAGSNWNQRDNKMYKKVEEIIGREKNTSCLIVTGNLHARKKIFKWKSQIENFVSLGSYFGKISKNILIRYVDATINNLGIVKIHDSIANKKLRNQDHMLVKSNSKFFDYEYIVKHSDAAELF